MLKGGVDRVQCLRHDSVLCDCFLTDSCMIHSWYLLTSLMMLGQILDLLLPAACMLHCIFWCRSFKLGWEKRSLGPVCGWVIFNGRGRSEILRLTDEAQRVIVRVKYWFTLCLVLVFVDSSSQLLIMWLEQSSTLHTLIIQSQRVILRGAFNWLVSKRKQVLILLLFITLSVKNLLRYRSSTLSALFLFRLLVLSHVSHRLEEQLWLLWKHHATGGIYFGRGPFCHLIVKLVHLGIIRWVIDLLGVSGLAQVTLLHGLIGGFDLQSRISTHVDLIVSPHLLIIQIVISLGFKLRVLLFKNGYWLLFL